LAASQLRNAEALAKYRGAGGELLRVMLVPPESDFDFRRF
jgi:hypothetical protein